MYRAHHEGPMPWHRAICPMPAVVAVAIPLAGGYLSGYFTTEGIVDWYEAYESLKTPEWKPPRKVFPIAWTSVYTCMGYASYIVWREGGGFHGPARLPLMMYGTQLAINVAWSPIFSRTRSLKKGLINILMLDAAVAATTFMFFKISPKAGCIMMAYCAWLSVDTYLNYRMWKDNPQ